MFKTLKYIAIVIVTLLLILILGIAFLLNVIFTPEKITPIVEKVAAENLHAQTSIGSVELTFFSTFPNFSLEVKRCTIRDTVQNDTILSVERLLATIDPMALVLNQKIEVGEILLQNPRIFGRIDSTGLKNWDIFHPSVDSTNTKTDSTTTPMSISLRKIQIQGGRLLFDDRQSGVYTSLNNFSIALSGDFAARNADIKTQIAFTDGLLWQNGELIFKNINFSTSLTAAVDSSRLIVSDGEIDINNLNLSLSGSIDRDSVDLEYALKVPSVASLMAMVPKSVLKSDAKLKTTGKVLLEGSIAGCYTAGQVPVVNTKLSIAGASVQYSGFRYGIDGLEFEGAAKLDLSRRTESYLQISKFMLRGASTRIDFQGEGRNLMRNPKFEITSNATINFSELAQSLPLTDSVTIRGILNLDLAGQFSAAELRLADYARIKANGSIDVKNVEVAVSNYGFESSNLSLSISNSKEGLLEMTSRFDTLVVELPTARAALGGANVSISGIKTSDSTSYLNTSADYRALYVAMDSVEIRSPRSAVSMELGRSAKLNFKSDSLLLISGGSRFEMDGAGLNVQLTRESLRGILAFKGLRARVPSFGLPLIIKATIIKINNTDIELQKAAFQVGRSDLLVSGSISDLLKATRGEAPLKVRAQVSSSFLDLTQIIKNLPTTSNPTPEIVEEKDPSVSLNDSIGAFSVPRNLDFELNSNFEKVEFGVLNVENVRGEITIKDAVVRLNSLALNTMGAEFATTIVYQANQAGLLLGSRAVDIASIIELIPTLDTLVPMLNSFEGVVDFSLKASTRFGPDFSMDVNDLKAAVAFHGENLVLLDGKTFAEISKLLLFKNKQRNVVDSIDVQMVIKNGSIEVFPFVVQMDRYRAAVGGEHFLNNNFNYHISVLKSPIPFKFGVNITGSLDDMKVGIGKTKYKSLNSPSYVRQVNPDFTTIGQQIVQEIREIK